MFASVWPGGRATPNLLSLYLVPVLLTVSRAVVKLTVTVRPLVMVALHVVPVVLAHPAQLLKVEPGSGVAASPSVVPTAFEDWQIDPHLGGGRGWLLRPAPLGHRPAARAGLHHRQGRRAQGSCDRLGAAHGDLTDVVAYTATWTRSRFSLPISPGDAVAVTVTTSVGGKGLPSNRACRRCRRARSPLSSYLVLATLTVKFVPTKLAVTRFVAVSVSPRTAGAWGRRRRRSSRRNVRPGVGRCRQRRTRSGWETPARTRRAMSDMRSPIGKNACDRARSFTRSGSRRASTSRRYPARGRRLGDPDASIAEPGQDRREGRRGAHCAERRRQPPARWVRSTPVPAVEPHRPSCRPTWSCR